MTLNRSTMSAEDLVAAQNKIIREYREQRVNLTGSELEKARERAVYMLRQMGMTAGEALRALEGQPKG